MKATGIVRRIDDLGRIVIPKEIRRTMRIREGDPLEIYTSPEGEVIFKKYSPVGELNTFCSQYADALGKTCGMNIVITDRDTVTALSGVPKKEYQDKHLSAEMEKICEMRELYSYQEGERKMPVVDGAASEYYASCVMPIIADGDVIGCVASLRRDSESPSMDMETEGKLVMTAAAFLAKQLES